MSGKLHSIFGWLRGLRALTNFVQAKISACKFLVEAIDKTAIDDLFAREVLEWGWRYADGTVLPIPGD